MGTSRGICSFLEILICSLVIFLDSFIGWSSRLPHIMNGRARVCTSGRKTLFTYSLPHPCHLLHNIMFYRHIVLFSLWAYYKVICMTISSEKYRQTFLIIYTFWYFKYIVLYMDCVINSNSGMFDMWSIDSVSFIFSFLLNYNSRTCTFGMVMHLSIDGSTSYFAQP